jgi:hypothetical protein
MDILAIGAAEDVVDFKRRVSIRKGTVPVESRRGMVEPRHRTILRGKANRRYGGAGRAHAQKPFDRSDGCQVKSRGGETSSISLI